ncbi:MAG: hypothetical protein H0U10_10990, partial [Chloroflexia bacterium]|nr:hypothetical protein [Chloroflexia bacterium]
NTHFAWSAEAALAAVAALGYPATLLPLAYRSAATPLLDIDAAEAVIEHRAVLGNGVETLALVQAGVAAGRASCFVVVDGEPVASDGSAIDRAASDEMAEANAAARNLAARAAHALGARLIGVVVAETAFGPVVWDVQPVPEFRHARPLSGRSVAEAVAAMAVRLLKAREAQRSPIGALEPRPASATTGLPTANGNANKLGDGNGNGNGKGFGDGNGRADAEEVRDGVALLA